MWQSQKRDCFARNDIFWTFYEFINFKCNEIIFCQKKHEFENQDTNVLLYQKLPSFPVKLYTLTYRPKISQGLRFLTKSQGGSRR